MYGGGMGVLEGLCLQWLSIMNSVLEAQPIPAVTKAEWQGREDIYVAGRESADKRHLSPDLHLWRRSQVLCGSFIPEKELYCLGYKNVH